MEKQLRFSDYKSDVIPYLYFLALAAFWFFGDLVEKQNVSFAALAIIVALTVQVVWQNRVVGISLGLFTALISFVAFLATLSEFNDFEVVTQSAIQLLAVGSVLSLCGLALGAVLTITNMRKLAV
ncbi:hypothetical protein [Pontibacter roseus]|uniref:hypothetical protein n=1 Tax=Pontibacter roseus TaxID=336989 RepID=UPI000367D592|nr:hypothetical protein [Pontibacter roseus]